MKKTSLKALLLAGVLLVSTGVFTPAASADEESREYAWNVTFVEDGSKMTDTFNKGDVEDVLSHMQPGDSAMFQVSLKNDYPETTRWYMENKVISSLEDSAAAANKAGGAYGYELSYTDASGNSKTLFESDTVGGTVYVDEALQGLKEVPNSENVEEDNFFYLGDLDAGKGGSVTLKVELDGETLRDAYQDTAAELKMRFAVEIPAEMPLISVKGKKTWDDAEDQDGARPKSITIRLKADGVEKDSVTVTEADNWEWEFTDLPKFEEETGEEIVYTVTEDAVADYTAEVNGFDITNTHTPDKTQVTVTKVWKDKNDADGIRPKSVTVKLLADGKDTGKTLTLSKENKWTGAFEGLDTKKEYTVEEEKTDVITGKNGVKTYAVKLEGNAKKGFTITNTHTVKKTIKPVPITRKGKIVKTGDSNRPLLYVILAAAAGVIMLVLALTAIRNRKKEADADQAGQGPDEKGGGV